MIQKTLDFPLLRGKTSCLVCMKHLYGGVVCIVCFCLFIYGTSEVGGTEDSTCTCCVCFHLRRLSQLRGGKVKYMYVMFVCTEKPQL